LALPTDVAKSILGAHDTDRLRHLFAQANASSVLYEVKEEQENFPHFDPYLIEKVTSSAYAILAAGASLHEAEPSLESSAALEKAATLLLNTHFTHAQDDIASSNHVLVAAMAFYACGQYSRSFVAIKPVHLTSRIAAMISLFLRRRRKSLIGVLNDVLLADMEPPSCVSLVCEPAIEISVAQVLSHILEFQASGNNIHIELALVSIDAGMEIASECMSPALWWVTRLLKLMIRGFKDSSLWDCLPPFFPDAPHLLKKYIQLSAFASNPVIELWASQKESIPIALDTERPGVVVNMRTSAGKTRVAELAILQTLTSDPSAKILYIAPYRSLALEIEQSLCQIFDWLGFQASHLYGGFRFSAVDRLLADEATITIATPEKTRAIVRSSPEMLSGYKLIVVDEGHLIGADERLIRNELFLDHLRVVCAASGGRLILLSAVLPNPAELAHWIGGAPENVAKSNWKPSVERFGLLRWNGSRVRIDWKGEFESFNPRFIESGPLGWGRRRNPFPNSKNEAIAATAVRLTSIGPVMIFCGQARSVPGMAKCVLMALGQNPDEHQWPEHLWNTFAASCREELGEDDIIFDAAKAGVICHSNKLPPQVRMATERLMRSKAPKIIIATSTLAQGVNIGISSVIIASPYIGEEAPITHRDFWNICGRAGRAFVDGEGKILYAIDETKKSWQVRKANELAEGYFNIKNTDPVRSGLLHCVTIMKNYAASVGVDFETLVGLVAENDFSAMGEQAGTYSYIFSMMDDALLALVEDPCIQFDTENPLTIIDHVFRASLASIQARNAVDGISDDDLISFLQSRVTYLLSDCPDPNKRQAYVSSGLPYLCVKNLHRDLEDWKNAIDESSTEELPIDRFLWLLEWIEEWARGNGVGVVKDWPEKEVLNDVRAGWLGGVPTSELAETVGNALYICKDIYGFQLPWLIHAGSQLFSKNGEECYSEILGIVATLVELGLPSMTAVNIFLAGVRSRVAACELAALDEEWKDTPGKIRKQLCSPDSLSRIEPQVSEDTNCWLKLIDADTGRKDFSVPKFEKFTMNKYWKQLPEKILVRKHNESLFLCSPDGRQRVSVKCESKWPFMYLANDLRFSFTYDGSSYQLDIRDPRIQPDDS